MIKISPSSLHERGQCKRCIWLKYHLNYSWPFNAGLYPRFSALEEDYVPTLDATKVLNNFTSGPISDAKWIDSKQNLQSAPIPGVDSHGKGEVIIGGEFDLMASYVKDGVERNAVIDCKSTGKKSENSLQTWFRKSHRKEKGDFGYPSFAEMDERYEQEYIIKYLPQLASYAYCLENPASDDMIVDYKEKEEELIHPPSNPKFRRFPQKAISCEVGSVGILMFLFEKNLELHGNRFHFTCESKWLEVDAGEKTWAEIVTPIAQNICDIIALDDLPKPEMTCGNCNEDMDNDAAVSSARKKVAEMKR